MSLPARRYRGGGIHVSASSLRVLRECPRQFLLQYLRGYPKEQISDRMVLGSAGHAGPSALAKADPPVLARMNPPANHGSRPRVACAPLEAVAFRLNAVTVWRITSDGRDCDGARRLTVCLEHGSGTVKRGGPLGPPFRHPAAASPESRPRSASRSEGSLDAQGERRLCDSTRLSSA